MSIARRKRAQFTQFCSLKNVYFICLYEILSEITHNLLFHTFMNEFIPVAVFIIRFFEVTCKTSFYCITEQHGSSKLRADMDLVVIILNLLLARIQLILKSMTCYVSERPYVTRIQLNTLISL